MSKERSEELIAKMYNCTAFQFVDEVRQIAEVLAPHGYDDHVEYLKIAALIQQSVYMDRLISVLDETFFNGHNDKNISTMIAQYLDNKARKERLYDK